MMMMMTNLGILIYMIYLYFSHFFFSTTQNKKENLFSEIFSKILKFFFEYFRMISFYRILIIIAFQQLTMLIKANAYFITVDETKFHLVKVIYKQ